MSVVGLDVGNYTSYVAAAAGGGIETVANEYSDRCTPSYVSMSERNRFVGVSAKNQATTNVKNTITCFKRLLARQFSDPQVQHEIKNFPKPFEIIQGPGGETLIQASYLGEKQTFSPEQMMGMLLTKLKETGEKALKTKVVDVVVSVPCFFTDIERKAMIACCQIAGLNCLKVMSDTTAVSLAYGIYKQDLPAENEKSRNVVFVDVGHSSIQTCVAAFNKGKLKVLSVASDSTFGGRDLDKLLVDHFSQEWKTKYKIDVYSKPKAYIRLTQECERLKKLMSANTQPIPIGIECFIDDKDVSSKMDRAEFEELVAPILEKVSVVFKQLLESSKLSTDDIYAVEVVGGSSRVPCIKDLVTKVFGKEPSTTLNADEAVSRGCALQCAILSPTFRVRDFAIADCQPYPITLSWQGGGMDEDTSLEVFPQFHQIPFSKMLTFYRKEPFTLEARYSSPSQIPFKDAGIGVFKISKVQPQPNGESSKVKVKVRVNNHGIFTVQSANMIEKLEDGNTDQEPESMDTDNGKDTDGSASDGKSSEPSSMETEQANGTPGEATPNADAEMKEEAPADKKEGDDGEKKSPEKKDGKKKKMTRSVDLPVEPMVSHYTKEAIHLLVEKENQMVMQDRLEKERCDAKNAVEEYVYDMRDKLCGPYEDFCKEADRENFNKLLGETEDWLYDEGEDQNKQVYLDKLAELRKTGDAIVTRYREACERPAAFEELGASLQLIRKFVDQCDAGDEKYSHLEKADVDKVKKCLKEKAEWFEKQMNSQNKMNKFDDPCVLTSQIRQTKQTLESTCNPIINKPKPKPKEEPPKDEKKEGGKKEGEGEKKGEEKQDEKAAGDKADEAQKGTAQAADMDVD